MYSFGGFAKYDLWSESGRWPRGFWKGNAVREEGISDSPQATSSSSRSFSCLGVSLLRFSTASSSACLSFVSGVCFFAEDDDSEGNGGALGGFEGGSEEDDVGEKRFPSHDICLDRGSYLFPNCSIALEWRSCRGLVGPDNVSRH